MSVDLFLPEWDDFFVAQSRVLFCLLANKNPKCYPECYIEGNENLPDRRIR